ncbi:MAG: trigger factor [Opitutales bacterium]
MGANLNFNSLKPVNTTVNDITETRKEVLVALSTEEINEEDKAVVQEFCQHAKVPGFRPGKAPQDVVRKRFAKQISEEFNRKVLTKAYTYVIKESGLSVLSIIEIDEATRNFEPGTSAEVRLTVDLEPTFDLPDYKGIEVSVSSEPVKEEEVEETLKKVYMQRANFEVVERAANKGDYVKVSYSGTIEGKPVSDFAKEPIYGEQKSTWEEAGAEEAPGVQAIIQGLVGMKAGDSKTVTQIFPENFHIDGLAGKTAEYTMSVEEVRERVMPEITEEFLAPFKVKTEEEFKDQIRKELEMRKKHAESMEVQEKVMNIMADRVDFPVPESALDAEVQTALSHLFRRETQRQALTQEKKELDHASMMEEARVEAKKRAKLRFVFAKIGEQEKIEVTDNDINQVIMQESYRTRVSPQELVKELRKDHAKVDNLKREILFNKTLDFLAKEAKVNNA